jgi:hypothetical protein
VVLLEGTDRSGNRLSIGDRLAIRRELQPTRDNQGAGVQAGADPDDDGDMQGTTGLDLPGGGRFRCCGRQGAGRRVGLGRGLS